MKQKNEMGSRALAPEILALGRLDRIMSRLSPDQQSRALQWLADRYAADTIEPARYEPADGEEDQHSLFGGR